MKLSWYVCDLPIAMENGYALQFFIILIGLVKRIITTWHLKLSLAITPSQKS